MIAQRYYFDQESVTTGNNVDVLLGGEEIFPALLKLIRNAKYRVYLQIYEFINDQMGKTVADELIAAAKRGCDVRLIYDHWGSALSSNRFFEAMKKQGVKVKCYHSFLSKDVGKKYFKRNHRKTLIVDSSHAMLGGFNIADKYAKEWRLGGIHDFSLLLDGPVCQQIYHYFDEVWQAKKLKFPRLKGTKKERRKQARKFEGQQDVRVQGNNHFTYRWRIRRDFLHAFKQAKESIWIINPYFIPDKAIIKHLIKAVDRGVDVKLIVPEKSDVRFVDYGSRVVLHKLINEGIKVYHWPGFSHGKAICVDRVWLSLGSYNFDYRSLLHNLELVAHTSDKQCVERFVQFYENAVSEICQKQDDQSWQKMSIIQKLLSMLFYRFRAFL
ncbi:MAG TPA: phosphatidylserine/phosphatidylglycerophosphate/cardiolipin synthase family protein [Oligoflexia bacterium]|nr:phosphatidylserine/phosphatidylglycerophosphate/cardiolipin synthase family protein [Oligoflexia bacterium]HMR24942.1 phosphatidylserine/phosphatidylglycerophosphate/cardiolipin synthase family protein [Oligoflexia bacterium]